MTNKTKYIWFNEDDTSRNPYAAFRKTFEVTDTSEILHIAFALSD